MEATTHHATTKKKSRKKQPMASRASTIVSEVAPNLDPEMWLARASEMLVARPGATLGIALGTGVLIGATVFNRIGRAFMIGALGLAGEMFLMRARTALLDGNDDDADNEAAVAS